MWNFGAVKHYCHDRGGEERFDAQEDTKMRHIEFTPFVLRHGPISELEGTKFEKRADFFNNTVDVNSKREFREIQQFMGTRTPEKGEKIQGHVYGEGGEKPSPKLYSFLGAKK